MNVVQTRSEESSTTVLKKLYRCVTAEHSCVVLCVPSVPVTYFGFEFSGQNNVCCFCVSQVVVVWQK